MRKLMVLAAMLAMMMAAAAPAFAQDQESGNAEFDADIFNEKGNQSVQIVNQQNTGNLQQEQDVEIDQELEQNVFALNAILAFISESGPGDQDVSIEGGDQEVNVTGENNATVTQQGISQDAQAEQNSVKALAIASQDKFR